MAADMMINVYRYFAEGELLFMISFDDDFTPTPEGELALTQYVSRELEARLQSVWKGLRGERSLFEDQLTNPKLVGEMPPSEEILGLIERAKRNCIAYLPDGKGLDAILHAYGTCTTFRPLGPDPRSGRPQVIDSLTLLNVGQDMYINSDDVDLALLYLVGELKLVLAKDPIRGRGISSFSISPNWRIAGSMAGGGLFSAPGVVPVPDPSIAEAAQTDVYGFESFMAIKELDSALEAAAFDPAQEVVEDNLLDIFVLDTLPSAGHLESIAAKFSDNELIQHFFAGLQSNGGVQYGTNGLRQLAYYTDLSDKEFFNLSLTADGQAYDQSPHGPFVAGLVRAICGTAQLHLIQTLNDNGLGSLKSMTWAIRQVIDHIQANAERTVVVNMSFGLTIQPEDVGEDVDFPLAKFTRYLLASVPQIDFLAEFNQAVETLTALTPCVFAAAGNDGECGTNYPPRLPAANPNVSGIGALVGDNPFDIACYSNAADMPGGPRVGFYALGGEANRRYTSVTGGMLSIYTNEKFPYGHHNTNGWGRWAGTSFAAPIVTGTVGALLASGIDKADVMQKLREIVSELPPTLDIVPVKQKVA